MSVQSQTNPPSTSARPPLITMTPRAYAQLQQLLLAERKRNPDAGLRLSVNNKGCNGKSYQLDYVNAPEQFDEVISKGEVKVFIDPVATMFIIGSEMDWQESEFASGFVFSNPNAKSQCGCGESFST